jgi:pyruvate dehydrogenase E1 component alpha subunit
LLCCADATGGKLPRAGASKQDPALTWTNLSRFAKKLRLPVFAVDGEDAVAVYRVMQESVIRARDGGGPAVLWAVLSPQPPTGLQRPLARLRSYLESRRISLRR